MEGRREGPAQHDRERHSREPLQAACLPLPRRQTGEGSHALPPHGAGRASKALDASGVCTRYDRGALGQRTRPWAAGGLTSGWQGLDQPPCGFDHRWAAESEQSLLQRGHTRQRHIQAILPALPKRHAIANTGAALDPRRGAVAAPEGGGSAKPIAADEGEPLMRAHQASLEAIACAATAAPQTCPPRTRSEEVEVRRGQLPHTSPRRTPGGAR